MELQLGEVADGTRHELDLGLSPLLLNLGPVLLGLGCTPLLPPVTHLGGARDPNAVSELWHALHTVGVDGNACVWRLTHVLELRVRLFAVPMLQTVLRLPQMRNLHYTTHLNQRHYHGVRHVNVERILRLQRQKYKMV